MKKRKLTPRGKWWQPAEHEEFYWVYFLQCEGFVKIGRSEPNNLKNRLREITKYCPFPMTFLGAIRSPVGISALNEKRIHIRFAKQAVHSEWFHLTDEIREFLETHRADLNYDLPDPKFTAIVDSFRQAPRTSRKVYPHLFADSRSRLL